MLEDPRRRRWLGGRGRQGLRSVAEELESPAECDGYDIVSRLAARVDLDLDHLALAPNLNLFPSLVLPRIYGLDFARPSIAPR